MSKRNYLSQEELEQFADITVTDPTEADDQIGQAEEIIDSYVGYQNKAVCDTFEGKATAGSATTLTLESRHQNLYEADYFVWCIVEIIGGTGIGQQARITSSTKEGVLTFATMTTPPDATSIYKIYQLGKFPRKQDEYYNTNETPAKYYRHIAEAVRRAVAAQVEYIIQMGAAFFTTDASGKQSESIGDYSYTNAQGLVGTNRLIAPKAKILLNGIKNRTGMIV
jgi:hypothetical protein